MEAGGQNWRTWEDLNDKRWIVLVEKVVGKMEEWDLMEVLFHRIRDPLEEEEEIDQQGVAEGITSSCAFPLFCFVSVCSFLGY